MNRRRTLILAAAALFALAVSGCARVHREAALTRDVQAVQSVLEQRYPHIQLRVETGQYMGETRAGVFVTYVSKNYDKVALRSREVFDIYFTCLDGFTKPFEFVSVEVRRTPLPKDIREHVIYEAEYNEIRDFSPRRAELGLPVAK